jgi:formate dehydrogenase gamma subunit
MMIELDKCIGCQACVTACKARWKTAPEARRDWVLTIEHDDPTRGVGITFYPGLCNQCADHPCTSDCPTGATFVDGNGVVVVDPDLCIGCGNCVPMCPYSARSADGRKGIVEKCNFCAPEVARGGQPACVMTCLAECRHFGDLDDPSGALVRLIRERKAEPLTLPGMSIGPKVHYAPPEARARILAAGIGRPLEPTALTRLWDRFTRPAARYLSPAVALLAGVAGVLVNLRARRRPAAHDAEHVVPAVEQPVASATLPRHRLGLRILHWWNALSWVFLVATGTALMAAPAFALFGTAYPRWLSALVGGGANLLWLHVAWGLLWALTIVPFFLVFKRGGIEALREIRLTADDLRWFLRKPLVMLGVRGVTLPPQDKYNAGQKVFALSALAGTALIIASGLVLTFHLGQPALLRAAILVHKLAILLALAGLAVHITMAAIIAEERPALRSMLTGEVAREHAESHSSKWVEEIEAEKAVNPAPPRDGTQPTAAEPIGPARSEPT